MGNRERSSAAVEVGITPVHLSDWAGACAGQYIKFSPLWDVQAYGDAFASSSC